MITNATGEVVYDGAGTTPTANDGDHATSRVLPIIEPSAINTAATISDGVGCHAGAG